MLSGFVYPFRQAARQMSRNKTMMWTSLFSMTAMMLLLGLFLMITVNMNLLAQNAKEHFDVVEVYLMDSISDEELAYLLSDLGNQSCISNVAYISKEEALRIMKTRWGRHAYLLDGLSGNPFPASLQLTMKDLTKAGKIARYVKKQSGVEDVSYRQDDINRIVRVTNTVQMGAAIVILFLMGVSVVVVANTIKLTVLARGKAISIMKYIGAGNWFIRGPFLVEGMILGSLSALLSSFIMFFLYRTIVSRFSENLLIMFSMQLVPAEILVFRIAEVFFVMGVSIGIAGSLISMRRFLDT